MDDFRLENWEALSSEADNKIKKLFKSYIKKDITVYDMFLKI